MKNMFKLLIAFIVVILVGVGCRMIQNDSNEDNFKFNSDAEFSYRYIGKNRSSLIYLSSNNSYGRIIVQTTDSNGAVREQVFKISPQKPNFKYSNEVYQTMTLIKYVPTDNINNKGFVKIKINHL